MLEIDHLGINLAGRRLIAPFSLNVTPGEIVTLMGPSGSGKSTILAAIGGDLDPAFTCAGTLRLNGRDLTGLPPERRHISRLFQDDLLFPHMTIGENLLFAIPAMARAERLRMMKLALQRAELEGFEDRPPHTLSGGQRSRVALMRALLAKPRAILLDEPFAKLDQDLRASIRDDTFSHIATRAIPALLVTHDADDAPKGGRLLAISKSGEVSDA